MKHRTGVWLCLILAVCLLAGCASRGETAVTCKDITVTFPTDFINLSEASYAEDADFLYGKDTLIVMGLAETKAPLGAVTLPQYTELVIKGNQLSATPRVVSNGYQFTYEASVDGTSYTYVVATAEGPENFWIVQCYCPSSVYEKNRTDISRILDSLQTTL